MSFLVDLGKRLVGYLLAAGGVLAALVAIWLKGRSDGKAIMREEQERHRREAIANKRKLDSEIDELAPADLDHRYGRWVRDEDRG